MLRCPRRGSQAIAALIAAVALLSHAAYRGFVDVAAGSSVVRFAVIGDFGTGTPQQFELAQVMADRRRRDPYEFVLTVGDNIYGGWSAKAVVDRFEVPYKALLSAGVEFFATLGNHDSAEEQRYAPFHMGGRRYYTFSRGAVDFFALDSNYLDPPQLSWLRQALAGSTAAWKIAFFHHPLYSSGGRHGSSADLRTMLQPLFTQYGVQVVFSGHDHVYERVKPQRGVSYFVCGSSGQLRRGNLDKRSPLTAAGFDLDEVFMRVEIDGDRLAFEAISRAGVVIDSGEIRR